MTATMTPPTTTALSVIAKRQELIACLSAVSLVAKPGPKPVLECVRLVVDDKAIQMDCTDLASRIRRTARQVQVEAQGTTCVHARDLCKFLTLLDDDVVTISVHGDQLVVKGEDSVRKFYTQPASDFPPSPDEIKEVARFTVSLDGLRLAHRFVAHAIPDKPTNYVLGGILFERVGKSVALVAAEGHILSRVGIATTEVSGDEKNIVIPGDFMSNVIRSLADDEGEVTIGVSENVVRIECGEAVAWSMRIQGHFTPWRDHIPTDLSTFSTAAREVLIAKLRIAADSATEGSKGVRLTISKSGIAIEQTSPTRGSSSCAMPCKVTGPDLVWGANSKFLLAALSGMVGDEVEIGWTAANRPAKITCGEMVEVVMPVNLQ